MANAFVVVNPVAGGSTGQLRRTIEEHFAGAGWDCQVYETTGQERVARVVRTALERDDGEIGLVVAAGGDGTVSGTAGGLVHAPVPLGVVPVGTGDTFARELGIPLGTTAALELLTGDHASAKIDAMAVSERFYVLNVSVGLSGLMMRDTARADKRRFGRVAYAWTGLRKLLGYQPHRFSVTVDGEKWTVRASEVMIANSGALGDPSLRWSPQVELNDGQVDVLVVRARTALDYLRFMSAVVLGRQSEETAIRHLIAERHAVVDARPELPVQADGEFIGRPPVAVEVVPEAVEVVVPEAGSERLDVGNLLEFDQLQTLTALV
jgi:YegS/Rv2252/BmrU family lipid kinase